MYLDNLIKYSELCLTGGLKSTAYANDLSDLCLNILRKDSQIWYQEFQYLEDIYELVIYCLSMQFILLCSETYLQTICVLALNFVKGLKNRVFPLELFASD